MRNLLNVLYVTIPEAYLLLDGETVVVRKEDKEAGKNVTVIRLPLTNLEGIVCFNYQGVSPALMGACMERNIGLCFLSPGGRFLARVEGKVRGNVLLRKKQYQIADDEKACTQIGAWFLLGKLVNCRKVIGRTLRDHGALVDATALEETSEMLRGSISSLDSCGCTADLMGFEGNAARQYFGVFDHMIIQQKEDFFFRQRNRRPPLDNTNALLSFLYTVLANEVASALEAVGLDPFVGFLHKDRPGRPSLALDLMEELRPFLADRLVLSLINRKQINGKGFSQKESGGILMDDDTRKKVITVWQERKRETLIHPFLQQKVEVGLIPHVQALLLARYLRGDLDAYPPFFWN